jgi:hypothetical protein
VIFWEFFKNSKRVAKTITGMTTSSKEKEKRRKKKTRRKLK